MMRRALLSLLGLSLFAPIAAHADSFTFTPTYGTDTYTFNVDPSSGTLTGSPDSYAAVQYTENGGNLTIYVYNQAYSDYFASNGYGQVDIQIVDNGQGLAYLLDGPLLFTGRIDNLQFIDGTYNLASSPSAGVQGGGTLTVSAATPEPSSLALLGTGVMGIAGAARRRFLNA